ncbi:protein ANTAGONIST OF LIKE HETEROCHROMATIN PROTEIN 1-like [Ischnura elegans]|uniref:protein ANTAGONIST OF LIKE HETEROCHROMATIN PROTEIN 1-like n=1 Tax=Ischnura elegans TaxID=197161 RepID=UPI001ED8A065|nr:protein ANTAGONIST OF LIKE HETEROCHROMATIN PROTEIN 1-like [Ischnura elegans]XP_046406064.1 protein ANTAGONIST OF LIKE HETEROCHROMATIN PROTEIN 1-like [Ischnura elegans]
MEEELEMLLILRLRRRRERRRMRQAIAMRRWWQSPILQRRVEYGFWENLIQEMRNQEPDKFLNFHRMSVIQFDRLLQKVEPHISRRQVVREPIPAGLKLSLTLRYLASGESMISLAYSYRVGKSTTSGIIAETCQAIWNVLKDEVLPSPTAQDWAHTAQDFGHLWNFPNCVGAIDGKHIIVQCFSNTGSRFYNYKGTFSTVLLASCDAQYCFTFVSIGSAGRESDGGIFQTCGFGQAILRERLPLPPPRQFDGYPNPLPAVFVGDAAFPLRKNLMRPFVGGNLLPGPTIFNYRLSRARRVIENTFGVMSNKFRIYRKPILASPETVDLIVQATVVLHNWLRKQEIQGQGRENYIPPGLIDYEDRHGIVHPGEWREEAAPQGMIPLPRNHARNAMNEAKEIRNKFQDYFLGSGAVPWQWNKLPEQERALFLP